LHAVLVRSHEFSEPTAGSSTKVTLLRGREPGPETRIYAREQRLINTPVKAGWRACLALASFASLAVGLSTGLLGLAVVAPAGSAASSKHNRLHTRAVSNVDAFSRAILASKHWRLLL
jgi:hypothetical protein